MFIVIYFVLKYMVSGGSRISRRGGGRGPVRGGMDLQRGCFSAKMYAKTKEFGPVGGRAPSMPPLDPSMMVVKK